MLRHAEQVEMFPGRLLSLLGGRSSRQSAHGYSVIDDRLTIRGEIETDGTVRIDGHVEGAVHRAGSLIVGAGGGIVGDIEASEIVIAGTVHGNVHATGRIEVEPGASVHGEIRANAMVLREGAIIHGKVSIGAPPSSAENPAGRRLELAPAQAPTGRVRL